MRILFMSGYTDKAVMRHGVLGASVAFLQKPFNSISLARTVQDLGKFRKANEGITWVPAIGLAANGEWVSTY